MIKSLPSTRKLIRYKNIRDFSTEEISFINSTIKEIEELAEKPVFDDDSLISFVLRHCKFLGKGACAKAYIKNDLVVKISRTCRYAMPLPTHREYHYFIPTIAIKIHPIAERLSYIVFQKKADTNNKTKAYYPLAERFPASKYDLHDDNVGMYKGKPVIFDC